MKKGMIFFPIVKFTYLDGDMLLIPLYGVYILQIVLFAHVWTNVSDFNDHNICVKPTGELMQQGYRYHKLLKTFTKLNNHFKDLIQKYDCKYTVWIWLGYQNLCSAETLHVKLTNSKI